jgi:HEAT repeat protein/V8-like Glu-specific endopeptidase
VLKSSVWILNVMGNGKGAEGSGTLIDKDNRLILTNYHVVYHHQQLITVFPAYEKDGTPIKARTDYMAKLKSRDIEAIDGRVIGQNEAQDLAIIQLAKLPEGVEALPIGTKGVKPGETVRSIGNNGLSGALFAYTPGQVRSIYRAKNEKVVIDEKDKSFLTLNCLLIETNSTTFHGDSGGPLVNKLGELIGVTEGGPDVGTNATFVELSEVRQFIEKTCQDNKITFVPAKRAPLRARRKASVPDLVKKLSSPDSTVRYNGAKALGEMGSDAREAVQDLVKLLKEDKSELNRKAAETALESIGAPARGDVGFLREKLKDTDVRVRSYAARALGLIGPEARSAGPDLLEVLKKKDSDAVVRQQAARSLGLIRYGDNQEVITTLTACLDDIDRLVRIAAAEALTHVRRSDITQLKKLLKHQDEEVRVVAATALGYLGRGARAALRDLIEAARSNTDRQVRKACIQTLAKFKEDAKDALPVFIDAMKDEELIPVAVLALAELGKEAKPAVKQLGEALSNENPNTRSTSLRALGLLGPDARDAVGDIVRLLKEGDRLFRIQVLDCLARIGPGAEEAVPGLIEILGKAVTIENNKISIDFELVDRAGKTLAEIGKPAVRPLLTAALTNDDKGIRLGAIRALGDMGYDAKTNEVLQNLQGLVTMDRDNDIRLEAKTAYGKIYASKKKPKRKLSIDPSKDKGKKPPVKGKPMQP